MNILEFARALEIRAEAAYRDCAAKTDQPALQAVFNLLAKGERHHQQVIKELEGSHPIQVPVASILGESRTLLQKLAPDKAALRAAGSQLDVYREALKQEEAAETFYREKSAEATEPRLKEVLASLAAQEHDHFLVLEWLVELMAHPETNLENAEFNRR